MSRQKRNVIAFFLVAFLQVTAGCGGTGTLRPEENSSMGPELRSEFSVGELERLCNQALQETQGQLSLLKSSSSPILEFERILTALSEKTTPLVFMGHVSTTDWLRKEAQGCEEKLGQFIVEVFTKKEYYLTLKAQENSKNSMPPDVRRLYSETIKSFEKNGLQLPDSKLTELRSVLKELSTLQTSFSTNLNEDKSSLVLSISELPGLPKDALERFEKVGSNQVRVTAKTPDYIPIMENVTLESTRKKMMELYLNRAAKTNTEILERALQLRQKAAGILGYPTWADYMTSDRMAKSSKAVRGFLDGLRGKLKTRARADLQGLLAFKKKADPSAKTVQPWDVAFLDNQIRKSEFQLDQEKIKPYFPSDQVMQGMFEVYSILLGIDIQEVKGAKVWAPDVKLYAVYDRGGKDKASPIAYFYADFFPREGKYGHAAAFTLRSGRKSEGGYLPPISSIVANFNPPTANTPSLLTHDEVETIFHEFGHIMHQTLTKAPFASLSGTAVMNDFVEAPSQMFENWVWSPEVLAKMSGHYQNPSQKLPKEVLNQMMRAKDFNRGYQYSRQVMLASTDLEYHTRKGKLDVDAIYDELYESILGLKPLQGGHFAAGFGHIMGGYDAGYYGYLWSEVYALDLFTEFEAKGLLNSEVGARYRKIILESGNLVDPDVLIEKFLGRKPNSARFFKELGLDGSAHP